MGNIKPLKGEIKMVKDKILQKFAENNGVLSSFEIESIPLRENVFASPSSFSRIFRKMRKNGDIYVRKIKKEGSSQTYWRICEKP
jgi:CTP-dependent riboflavin kinase